MKKALLILLVVTFVAISGLVLSPTPVFAASACPAYSNVTGTGITLPAYTAGANHVVTINMSQGFDTSRDYHLEVFAAKVLDAYSTSLVKSPSFRLDAGGNVSELCQPNNSACVKVTNYVATFTIKDMGALVPTSGDNKNYVVLVRKALLGSFANECELGTYNTSSDQYSGPCNWTISQQNSGNTCYYTGNSCLAHGSSNPITLSVSGLKHAGNPYNGRVEIDIKQAGLGGEANVHADSVNGVVNTTITLNSAARDAKYDFKMMAYNSQSLPRTTDFAGCELKGVSTKDGCSADQCNTSSTSITTSTEDGGSTPYYLCDQLPEGSQAKDNCLKCASGGEGGDEGEEGRAGVWTAVGCINRSPKDIIGTFIRLGLTMGGGISLLMILGSGFIISVSAGDPKRTGEAKEMLVAAVTGLIFIIFSVAILQFIGYSVLQIPGFGG